MSVHILFDAKENFETIISTIYNRKTQKEHVIYKNTFPIGQLLIDFIELDLSLIYDLCKEMDIPQNIKGMKKNIHQYKEMLYKLSDIHPYFHCYLEDVEDDCDDYAVACENYFERLKESQERLKESQERLKKIQEILKGKKDSLDTWPSKDLYERWKNLIQTALPSEDPQEHCKDLIRTAELRVLTKLNPNLLLRKIKEDHDKFKETVSFCLYSEHSKDLIGLNTSQRYYLYINLINNEIADIAPKILHSPTFDKQDMAIEDSCKTVEKFAGIIRKKTVSIFESFEVNLTSACYIELMKLIRNNTQVSKCKNCNKFFIPYERVTAKYCNHCKVIGPRLQYENKIKDDEIVKEYRKAYKRNNSRVRIGKWNNEKFRIWADNAKDKFKEAKEGKITLEEFKKWLEEDKSNGRKEEKEAKKQGKR